MSEKEQKFIIPGPLSTTMETKQAMLHDIDPWSPEYGTYIQGLMKSLVAMVHGGDDFVCLPVPGAGTYGVEALVGTVIPRDGKVLALVNGHYSRQIRDTMIKLGRNVTELKVDDGKAVTADMLDKSLTAHPDITHVTAIHCETVTGVLQPIEEMADVVERHGKSFLVDTISTFGGMEIDLRKIKIDGMVATSNKCLEGLPGLAFVFCRKSVLEECEDVCSSLSLDLYRTWRVFEDFNSWRMTAPVQIIAAMDSALQQLEREGGVSARAARYRANRDLVIKRMREYGFTTLAQEPYISPIIVPFHCPIDPNFDLMDIIERVKARGYIFSRGKTEGAVTFRISCIGQLGADDLNKFMDIFIEEIEKDGVSDLRPEAFEKAG